MEPARKVHIHGHKEVGERTSPVLRVAPSVPAKAPVCEHSRAIKISHLYGSLPKVSRKRGDAARNNLDSLNLPHDWRRSFAPPPRPQLPVARVHLPVIFAALFINVVWAVIGPILGGGSVNIFCAGAGILVIGSEMGQFLQIRAQEPGARRDFARDTQVWQEAVRRWDRLYYCPTCRHIYDLETGQTVRLCALSEILEI